MRPRPTRRCRNGSSCGWIPKDDQESLLPLAQASRGTFDAEGKRLVFTRFSQQGSSTKRYRGGWIENLWRYDGGDTEAVALTADFKGTSRTPMWWRDRIYFSSDRDGVMNLWSMKPDGTDLKQLTHHQDYDVKTPSLSDGKIVYQCGADLWLFIVASGEDKVIPIELASDFDQERERWVKRPQDFLTSAHISPDGDRLVLTARGQVFVAPLGQGRFVEVRASQTFAIVRPRFCPMANRSSRCRTNPGSWSSGNFRPMAWAGEKR